MAELIKNNQGSKTFVSAYQDRFTTKANPNEEGAICRKNSNGKDVWYFPHAAVKGFITNISFHKNESSQYVNLNIALDDNMVLSFIFGSSISITFFQIVPNVDFTKEVKFELSMYKKPGKEKASQYLFLKQDDGSKTLKNVKPYWNKERSQGVVPEWVVIVDQFGSPILQNGRQLYNKDAQLNYYWSYMVKNCFPKIKTANQERELMLDNAETIQKQVPASNAVVSQNQPASTQQAIAQTSTPNSPFPTTTATTTQPNNTPQTANNALPGVSSPEDDLPF